MAERFSAHLKINRTVVEHKTGSGPATRHITPTDTTRTTDSVELTVRAPTLERLAEKVSAHLALLDSDDFITVPSEATCR